MNYYSIKFFRDGDLITTGHGYAEDVWDAYDKADLTVWGLSAGTFTYDRCVVVNENMPCDEVVVYDKNWRKKTY